jgi:hypothetical protein
MPDMSSRFLEKGGLGGVRQQGAPVAVRCAPAVATPLALGQAPPNTVIHGRVHGVGKTLASDGAPAANGLRELVLESAGGEKQVGVVLRAQGMRPPVLIGVQ